MRSCPLCGAGDARPFFAKEGYELARCASCDGVYVANPPSADELARFYSFAAGYGLESRDDTGEIERLSKLARRHLEQLERHARTPGRLVDVGCGAGFFLLAARTRGWGVRGIELNSGTAGLARRRYGLDVVTGRLEEGVLGADGYDAMTLWDVLEHVPEPRATLAAVRASLREGGLLAVSTPNLGGLFPRLSAPIARRTGYWTHPEPPAHLTQFSELTLRRLLQRSGFEVLEVIHERTPVKYTLAPGGLRRLSRSPGRALYAAVFLVPHLVGPHVGSGDEIVVFARSWAGA